MGVRVTVAVAVRDGTVFVGVTVVVRVGVRVAVLDGVPVGVWVAVAVDEATGVFVALAVRVAEGVGVGVLVELGAASITMTSRLLALAASPALVPLWFTALPQARRVTVVAELGAVQRKENVTTPLAAGFGAVWVISACPAAIFVCVRSELLPPLARTPLADDTFRPPWPCAPVSWIISVYSLVEPFGTLVGPVNETSGKSPPKWHWLQPPAPKLTEVMPLEKARAAVAG